MNGFRAAALVLALAGLGTLAYAVSTGEMNVAFVLIFPVIYGSGALGFLGIVLLFGAFIAWGMGAMADARRAAEEAPPVWRAPPDRGEGEPVERAQEAQWADRERRTKGGGVILLGPIPIVWGSDQGIAKNLLVLAVILVALWLLAMLVLRA